jgi:hypothetical protein
MLRKLLVTATVAVTIVGAGALTSSQASAMPIGSPAAAADQLNLVDPVALCFYFDGWNGPGMYECGFRHRRGMGWHGRREGGRGMHRGPSPRVSHGRPSHGGGKRHH